MVLLFVIIGVYVFFYFVFCSGIIGKYKLRMKELRPIEPKIEFDE